LPPRPRLYGLRDCLTGTEITARARYYHDLGVGIRFEIAERFIHFKMELRVHRVPLFRTVEHDPADPVPFFDLDAFQFLGSHKLIFSVAD
jgi:hypothetical protein